MNCPRLIVENINSFWWSDASLSRVVKSKYICFYGIIENINSFWWSDASLSRVVKSKYICFYGNHQGKLPQIYIYIYTHTHTHTHTTVLFYTSGVDRMLFYTHPAQQPMQLTTWPNQPASPSQPDNPWPHPGPGGFLFPGEREPRAARSNASGEREPAAQRRNEGPIQRAAKVCARESRTTRERQRCVLGLGRLVDRAAAHRSRIRTRGSGAAARRSGADRRRFFNPYGELKPASQRGRMLNR
jgi:hypothetical protein